jgi:hypothetical protein
VIWSRINSSRDLSVSETLSIYLSGLLQESLEDFSQLKRVEGDPGEGGIFEGLGS